jgi:zinc transport system substrate-binding protein
MAALLLGGCSPAAPPAKPLVVATVYPIWELTRQVAGEHASVVSLVPPGVEPHDWEPTPQDLAQVQRARALVYNGAGLEPWVERLLPDAAARGIIVVTASEGLPLVRAGADAHGHGGGAPDPHVWLDPALAQSMVEAIRGALTKMDPGNALAYAKNAQAFAAHLQGLDRAFAQGLRECARREVVVSHDAFGYLARRYRFTVVPVAGLSPAAEPTPSQLASIVRFARQRKVKYILFETLVSPRLAETLAREVGAQTLVLNPIEGLTREEAAAGKGYLSLMEDNLRTLRTALECR